MGAIRFALAPRFSLSMRGAFASASGRQRFQRLRSAAASARALKWPRIGDDYEVLENGQVAPQDRAWRWASGHNGKIRRAAHGYEPTREAAMAAFAKSWRRDYLRVRDLLLCAKHLFVAAIADGEGQGATGV